MFVAETMVDLLKDWHHWGFETVAAVVEFGVMALVARVWVKYHDAKKHGHKHCDEVHD